MRLNPRAVTFVPGRTIHQCRQDAVKAKRVSNNVNALRRIRHRITKLTVGLTNVTKTADQAIVSYKEDVKSFKEKANAVYKRIAMAKKVAKNIPAGVEPAQKSRKLSPKVGDKNIIEKKPTQIKEWLQNACGICPTANLGTQSRRGRFPPPCKRVHCLGDDKGPCEWLHRQSKMHGSQLTTCFMAGHKKFENPHYSTVSFRMISETQTTVKAPLRAVPAKTSAAPVKELSPEEEKIFDEGQLQFEALRAKRYEDELARMSRPIQVKTTPQPTVQSTTAVQTPVVVPTRSTTPSRISHRVEASPSREAGESIPRPKAEKPVEAVSHRPASPSSEEAKKLIAAVKQGKSLLAGADASTTRVLVETIRSHQEAYNKLCGTSHPLMEMPVPTVQSISTVQSKSSRGQASSSKAKLPSCGKCKKVIETGDPVKMDGPFHLHARCHRCNICFESFSFDVPVDTCQHPGCAAKVAASTALRNLKGKFW